MCAADLRFQALATAVALFAPMAALAQNEGGTSDKPGAVVFRLSEASVPGAQPWQEPASLSFRIDRHGKDTADIALNLAADITVVPSTIKGDFVHTAYVGPSASYKFNNASDSRSDALKLGVAAKYWRDWRIFGDKKPPADALFYAATLNVDYAREGVYPDRSKAPCDTDTTSAFCRKQFSESLKTSIGFYPFLRDFNTPADARLKVKFRPKFELAHDQILDGAIDPDTGGKVTGGYTTVFAGAGVRITPSPVLEFNLTGGVRQRLASSRARANLIDRTEERTEISATYYVVPPSEKGWRAGFSVIWTEGGDSFAGSPKESTILLAFRIGHF